MKRMVLASMLLVVTWLAGAGLSPAQAQVKEYRIPVLADFSGPFADTMKSWNPPRIAILKWWSDTEGKKLGVSLVPKTYDTRYDATVVASLWPGIVSELNPIMALGVGGADVAALQQRLPKDKIPVIYGTASYGFGWLPNQWVFNPRATYAQEILTALVLFINQHPEKRPVRVGIMSAQTSPAFVDLVNGITKYIKTVLEPKGLATVVATEWIEIQPVDVSVQMKKLIDAKADIMTGIGTTTMAGAAIRAMQLHGVNIPTIAAPHHTIWPLAQAMKSYAPWEGHLVAAGHVSMTEKDSKAYKFYQLLQKNYGLQGDWNPISFLGLCQGILAVRAVEHAAMKVGGAKLTGQAVYDALSTGTFTEDELMGLMPTLHFTKEAPFPMKDAKVKIETVKDGKYQLAAPGWQTIPADIVKW